MSTRKLIPIATMLIGIWVCQGQSTQSMPTFSTKADSAPLLLKKNEGEQRMWHDPPPGGFMLKVSPKNNGSQHLVMGREDIPPGNAIPRHKHLGQDEIVFVQNDMQFFKAHLSAVKAKAD
jgi:hypothetical protein